jgi:hypothetical protein
MKRLLLATILLLMCAGLSLATVTITADSSAKIGETLGVKILYDVNGTPQADTLCSVYTTSNGNDMLDLFTYDSILNEPAGLKTNAGGYGFLNIQITAKYPVDTNYKVYAYCGADSASSDFIVRAYAPTDVIANFLISIKDNPIAWVIGLIVIIAVVILLRMAWKAK